jgi:small-conductance mechanosensitive channel
MNFSILFAVSRSDILLQFFCFVFVVYIVNLSFRSLIFLFFQYYHPDVISITTSHHFFYF